MYYAGRGNKFWRILYETGLTPLLLTPDQFLKLPEYRLGLTDIVKGSSGSDSDIDFSLKSTDVLTRQVERFMPRILCFNGKRAGKEFLARPVEFGLQVERIGETAIFVVPSTSGAANEFWDIRPWTDLAQLAGL